MEASLDMLFESTRAQTFRPLIAGLIVLFFVCKYGYRLWFHPLACYPGPFLARVSSGWSFFYAAKLQKAQMIQSAHEKYGPAIRVAPDQLSFNDPTVLKEIYGHGSGMPKTTFYAGGHFTQYDNLFSQRDKTQHSGRRSLLAKAFSQNAIMTHLPTMQSNCNIVMNHWSRLSDGGKSSVDVYHWVHWFALDVVFVMILGTPSGILVKGENHAKVRDLEAFIPAFAWTALCPPLRQHWPKVPIKMIRKPFELMRGWIEWTLDAVILSRAQEKGTRTPIMERLLEDTDPALGRRLHDLEIVEEILSFFFAGSGTTANTTIFLIWSVLKDPRIHQTLIAELRKAFPDPGQMPEVAKVNDLPYTNSVIMETLRKYPAIPGTQPRYVLEKDIVLLGRKVPKGMTVGTQNYSIHRSTEAFPDPEAFLPERWLGLNSTIQTQAFNGFGTGPRACIGRNMAFLEMKTIVPAFFIRFDALIAPDFVDSNMTLTDGFAGGPAGESLRLILGDRSVPNEKSAA